MRGRENAALLFGQKWRSRLPPGASNELLVAGGSQRRSVSGVVEQAGASPASAQGRKCERRDRAAPIGLSGRSCVYGQGWGIGAINCTANAGDGGGTCACVGARARAQRAGLHAERDR